MSHNIHKQLREEAQTMRELFARYKETFVLRENSPQHHQDWRKASAAWRQYHPDLATTFCWKTALYRLETGDAEMLELAICIAEVNPYFYGSGYLRINVFRRLKRLKLSPGQEQRILDAVLNAVREHRGSGWKEYCRLAIPFANPAFAKAVGEFIHDPDPYVSERARTLVSYLERHCDLARPVSDERTEKQQIAASQAMGRPRV